MPFSTIDDLPEASLDGTETLAVTKDPAGTPVSSKTTVQAVADLASGSTSPPAKAVLLDDMFGSAVRSEWALSGGSVALPGGVAQAGGVLRQSVTSGLSKLQLPDGSVRRSSLPVLETRFKLSSLADVIVNLGLLNGSYADASYLQFSSASSFWQLVTGNDATVTLATALGAVVADTWYRLRIEEHADRVDFYLGADPDGITSAPLVASHTTNLPSTAAADRHGELMVYDTAAAAKAVDYDFVLFASGRAT